MKILFVHEVNYSSKVIFEMHEFPELLASRGHTVTFVDFAENEPIAWLRRANRIERVAGRTLRHVSITRITQPRRLPYPLDRLYTAATSTVSIGKILDKVRPDVIVLYSVPTNGWQTVIAAKRRGIPVVYRAIDVSHLLRRSIFRPLIRRAEIFVYRNSDRVIANNDALSEYGKKLGSGTLTTRTLAPGFKLPTSRQINRNDEKRIVFMGTFFRFAGLDWFLRELHPKIIADPTIRLSLIGGGEHESHLRAIVAELGLSKNVTFEGFVPFDELASHLLKARVAVLPFQESEVTNLALPGKVPQYLLCGLPTVATRLKGLQSLLPEGHGVRYAAPGKSFVDCVIELLNRPDECDEITRKGAIILQSECDWGKVIEMFEGELHSLIV